MQISDAGVERRWPAVNTNMDIAETLLTDEHPYSWGRGWER